MENKPTIWLYWENSIKRKEEPELVKRCKQLYNKYDNVTILNEKTIHDYLPDIIDCSRINHLAQKVDYYRSKLLYEYGGIWLDFDMILLDDITYLYNDLIDSDYSMMGKYNDKICSIPFLIFKPKTKIAELWYKFCEEYIQSNKYIYWASLGGTALGNIIYDNNYINDIKPIPNDLLYSLGYKNGKYNLYYKTEPDYVRKKLLEIKNKNVKIITLYGTFMYDLPIKKDCLLDKMFELG